MSPYASATLMLTYWRVAASCGRPSAPTISSASSVALRRPFHAFNGMSANTRSAWSLANARQVIGYEPEDDSKVVYADESRRFMVGPAREGTVQGEARGGKGSR